MALIDLLKLMGVQEAEAAQSPVQSYMDKVLMSGATPATSFNMTAPENLRKSAPAKPASGKDPVTSKTSQLVARTRKELDKLRAAKDSKISGLQNVPTDLGAPIQDSEFMPTKPVDQRYADAMKLLGPKNKGQKSSISMDYPQFLSDEESLDLARNADLASQVMGLGAFENSVGAENSREIIKSFKDRLKSLEENYAEPTLAYGAGAILTKNPLLASLAGQKYQSADEKVLSTQEKFANALTKISDMYNKTDADKIDLYKAQKLPPGNLKLAQDTDLPRLPSSRSGKDPKDKELTVQEAKLLNEATGGLGELISTKEKLDTLLPSVSINAVRTFSVSPTLGSFASAVSDDAKNTNEFLGKMADFAAKYNLQISGKAVTDREQARFAIVQQLTPATTKEGLQTAYTNMMKDFNRQLSLQATSLGDRRTKIYAESTGTDPKAEADRAKKALEGAKPQSFEDFIKNRKKN